MASRRFVAIASVALFVVAALGGCSLLRQPRPRPTPSQQLPPKSMAYPRCPEATRWITGNRTGTQGASSSAGSNKTWNLTGFTHTTTPDPTRYPFRLEGVRNVCIVGGRIIGNIPDTYSRTQWYDGIGIPSSAPKYDGTAFRIVQKNGWALIRDAYVERMSDAYNPQGPRTARFYLDHVHAKDIQDDCVEDDLTPHSIYVKDSLFDGCHNFMSEREEDASYADRGRTPGETVIDNSLVYVEPTLLGPKYCDDNDRCVNDRGARGLFKWSPTATRNLVVRNTILRLDQRSYSSDNGDKFPKGTYQNVTLVWLGSGDYPQPLPPGVRLTRDKRVWDDAKAAWLKQAAQPPAVNPYPTPRTPGSPSDAPFARLEQLVHLIAGHMMGWYDDGLGWVVWIGLMMLAFWALLIFGGIAVYRSVRRDDGRSPNSRGGAERLLDERFARGEIDADEYIQRRELLRSGR